MNQPLKPTNVKFIDHLLGGGTKPGGVYGILSPPKVGKSMLANMIAANGATGESIFTTPLYTHLSWMLFDLHNGRRLTSTRIISHVGKIRREDVWFESDEIQAYEQERQDELPTENGTIRSSSSRGEFARKALHKQVIPWSDADEQPPFSSRATQEWISHQITATAFQYRGVGGIVIDGARDVWHASQGETKLSKREFLSRLVPQFCRSLARQFQCPVWITHQTCDRLRNVPPTTQLTHQDAADCKSFADSMDACLVMGTASESDPDRGIESVFSIRCTKGDPKIISGERILLKYDRDFSSIVEAKDYMEDRRNRTWKQIPRSKPLIAEHDEDHLKRAQ